MDTPLNFLRHDAIVSLHNSSQAQGYHFHMRSYTTRFEILQCIAMSISATNTTTGSVLELEVPYNMSVQLPTTPLNRFTNSIGICTYHFTILPKFSHHQRLRREKIFFTIPPIQRRWGTSSYYLKPQFG